MCRWQFAFFVKRRACRHREGVDILGICELFSKLSVSAQVALVSSIAKIETGFHFLGQLTTVIETFVLQTNRQKQDKHQESEQRFHVKVYCQAYRRPIADR